MTKLLISILFVQILSTSALAMSCDEASSGKSIESTTLDHRMVLTKVNLIRKKLSLLRELVTIQDIIEKIPARPDPKSGQETAAFYLLLDQLNIQIDVRLQLLPGNMQMASTGEVTAELIIAKFGEILNNVRTMIPPAIADATAAINDLISRSEQLPLAPSRSYSFPERLLRVELLGLAEDVSQDTALSINPFAGLRYIERTWFSMYSEYSESDERLFPKVSDHMDEELHRFNRFDRLLRRIPTPVKTPDPK